MSEDTVVKPKRKRRTKAEMAAFRAAQAANPPVKKRRGRAKKINIQPSIEFEDVEDFDNLIGPSDAELASIEAEEAPKDIYIQTNYDSKHTFDLGVRILVTAYNDFFEDKECNICKQARKLKVDPVMFDDVTSKFKLTYDRSELYDVPFAIIQEPYSSILGTYRCLLDVDQKQECKTILYVYDKTTNKPVCFLSKHDGLGYSIINKDNLYNDYCEWWKGSSDYHIWVSAEALCILSGREDLYNKYTPFTSLCFGVPNRGEGTNDKSSVYFKRLTVSKGNDTNSNLFDIEFCPKPEQVTLPGGVYKKGSELTALSPWGKPKECPTNIVKSDTSDLLSDEDTSQDKEINEEIEDEEYKYEDNLLDNPWKDDIYYPVDEPSKRHYFGDDNPYYSGTRLSKDSFEDLSDGSYRSRNMGLSDGSYGLDDWD